MSVPFSVRPAHAQDLAAIYSGELDYILQAEPHQEKRWKDAIPLHLKQWTSSLDRMFVAESGGEVVGYFFWEVHDTHAELASIYMVPHRRREGVACRLLEAFLVDAARHGLAGATLGVKPDNPARIFYEKMGFTRTGTERGYHRYRCDFSSDPLAAG